MAVRVKNGGHLVEALLLDRVAKSNGIHDANVFAYPRRGIELIFEADDLIKRWALGKVTPEVIQGWRRALGKRPAAEEERCTEDRSKSDQDWARDGASGVCHGYSFFLGVVVKSEDVFP
jgi:hypothetical protein